MNGGHTVVELVEEGFIKATEFVLGLDEISTNEAIVRFESYITVVFIWTYWHKAVSIAHSRSTI